MSQVWCLWTHMRTDYQSMFMEVHSLSQPEPHNTKQRAGVAPFVLQIRKKPGKLRQLAGGHRVLGATPTESPRIPTLPPICPLNSLHHLQKKVSKSSHLLCTFQVCNTGLQSEIEGQQPTSLGGRWMIHSLVKVRVIRGQDQTTTSWATCCPTAAPTVRPENTKLKMCFKQVQDNGCFKKKKNHNMHIKTLPTLTNLRWEKVKWWQELGAPSIVQGQLVLMGTALHRSWTHSSTTSPHVLHTFLTEWAHLSSFSVKCQWNSYYFFPISPLSF